MRFSDFLKLSNRRSINEMEGIVRGVRDNFAGETERFTLLGALWALHPRPADRNVVEVKAIKRWRAVS